jgi:glucokinase
MIDYGGTHFRYSFDGVNIIDIPSNGFDIIDFFENIIIQENIKTVGISFAGQVNNGIIVDAPNISLKNFDMKSYLEDRYNIPLYINNDLKCATIAHYNSSIKSLLVVYVGTGIGMGYIQNGELLSGNSNFAGEVGHIPYREAPFKCGCGKSDCIELFASGSGVAKWSKYYNLEYDRLDKIDYIGDGKIVIDNFYDAISFVFPMLNTIFNPSQIVIGGGMANQKLLDFIIDSVKTKSLPSSANPKITLSNIENAPMIGAGIMAKSLIK